MGQNSVNKKKTNWWKWLLMLACSIILLFFAFKGVKWSDFVEGLESSNFWWIGAAMAVSILGFIIRAFRWRIIMLPLNKNITRKEAFDGVNIGYLTNFTIPRAGELARCGIISNTGKASFESIVGTVVLERTFDLICNALIALTVFYLYWSQIGDFISHQLLGSLNSKLNLNIGWIMVILCLSLITIIILLYLYQNRLKKYKFFAKIFDFIKGIINGLTAGFKMKGKIVFFLYTILLWTCYWFMSFAIIKAFPATSSLGASEALVVMLIGGFGWLVPVQGGIGAYHLIVSLAMTSLYALPKTAGIIFATINHESETFTMLLFGIISLISVAIRNRKKENRKVNTYIDKYKK
ncbi:MAG: lysylphosphatidylglycerol synthase transmembrane domain-containing protein [Bacteroidales bacterium]